MFLSAFFFWPAFVHELLNIMDLFNEMVKTKSYGFNLYLFGFCNTFEKGTKITEKSIRWQRKKTVQWKKYSNKYV